MEIVLESALSIDTPLRQRVEARLRFMLRRLSWLVPRAVVRLSEPNGTRDAAGKRCSVELSVADGGNVVASATARDWSQSIDDALQRAARLLARRLRRVQGD